MAGRRKRNWSIPDSGTYARGPARLPHGQLPPPPGANPTPRYYPGYDYPASPPGAAPPDNRRAPAGRRLGLLGVSALLIVPFIMLLTIFLMLVFVGKPYIVHGESMMKTLHDGDRVFVVPYRGDATPDRGDIVVLEDIDGSPEMLIKRVVAIGGDRVTIENGWVVVNGKYKHRSTSRYVPVAYTKVVPDGGLFVMGDNEAQSFDSRTFGAIPGDKVIGKALLIFWPPGDWKKL